MVLVIGRYREIHRDPREAYARRRAEQLFSERPEWWLPGTARLPSEEHEHAVIYQHRSPDWPPSNSNGQRAPVLSATA